MARRKSSSNSGCGTLVAEFFGFGIIITLVLEIIIMIFGALIEIIAIGAIFILPLVCLIALVYLTYRFIFFWTHREPLTYEQVERLSKMRAQNYITTNYKFKKKFVLVNPIFKSNLDVVGRWYKIEEPLDTFPAYISALLEGKHHEWVVIAIERNGLVYWHVEN